MSTRSTLATAVVLALLTTLLVGATRAAADPTDARADALQFYTRGKTYTCTGDFSCNPPDIVIRCKPGDFATGGSAWRTDNPGDNVLDHMSRPWRKRGVSRGWLARGRGIGPGDQITVQVICALQG